MRAERVLAMIAAGGLIGCTGQPASPVSDGTEAPVAAASAEWAAISGTYEVVAVRRASLTAAPLDPDSDNSDLLGEVVTLDPAGITSPGGECVPDGLVGSEGPDVIDTDPMLADLRLPGLDEAQPQPGRVYTVTCSDGSSVPVYMADRRAIAIPWDNGASYLIAERPLTPQQVKHLQEELIDMKFQSGPASTDWTEDGLTGLRAYYDYRKLGDGAYNFYRPVLTSGLLDGLGVEEQD